MPLTSPLNLPAPGRCQTLYFGFTPSAESCVLIKQSPEPGFCDPQTLHMQDATRPGVPLLPKLRGQLAEFLDEGSPVRLGLLSQPTCVGLEYERPGSSLEAFLGSVAFAPSHHHNGPHGLSRLTAIRFSLDNPPTALERDLHHPPRIAFCVTPSVQTLPGRGRIVYRLSIEYASRPPLRSRLTLGG